MSVPPQSGISQAEKTKPTDDIFNDKVMRVVRELKDEVPISLMFCLSPWNNFEDMRFVIDVAKRLPVFYREESMNEYFAATDCDASEENLALITGSDKASEAAYSRRLERLIVSMLYSTGMRRAELIGLRVGDVDFARGTMTVRGKGDKVREIPLVSSLCKEISLYLQAVETMVGRERSASEPLAVTGKGLKLYPVFIDRAIKRALGRVGSITGRKSPHVLRHSLATELLDEGADLNSIKELLGHSSLAATQVYTHNTIEKLKKVYVNAHPRAKSGGKNGD